jgi:hypothetical protein
VRIRRRKVRFESLAPAIQERIFHQCEINWLDREQVEKAAENRQKMAYCLDAWLATRRESREFLDFFKSPK